MLQLQILLLKVEFLVLCSNFPRIWNDHILEFDFRYEYVSSNTLVGMPKYLEILNSGLFLQIYNYIKFAGKFLGVLRFLVFETYLNLQI